VTGSRSALIVACDGYSDAGLRRLRAPASDARALAGVLQNPAIGGFEVRTLLNEPAHEVALGIEGFFADRVADDLLLLHLSCHGVKDEDGELYFAMANTALRRLAATGVAADFVNRRMNRSRSRRVVLLLDCCYAGAFERGMTARAGTGVAIESQFGGRGRAVITASSAMEYAFEGDELADAAEVAPSVFTSALVEGLATGDADRDQDGAVSLDELYDYIYDKVRTTTPNQTPGKWTFGVQGELVIARRALPVTQPSPLPQELQEAIDSPLAAVRGAAVKELSRLLRGKHAGRVLAARQALDELTGDDSRSVAAAAASTLSDVAEDDGREAEPIPATPPQPDVPRAVIAEQAPQARPEPEPPARPDPAPTVQPEPEPQPPAQAEPEPQPPAQAEPEPQPPAQAEAADNESARPTPLAHVAALAQPAEPLRSSPGQQPESDAAPAPDEPRSPAADQGSKLLVAAGIVAIAGAVVLVVSLFSPFVGPDALSAHAANTWQNGIEAVAAAVAGCCLLTPSSRQLIGPGILLGAIATAPSGGVYDLIVGVAYPPIGPGLWINVVACVILTVAGGLAWRALARHGAVHIGRRVPSGVLPWLVILVGCAGAVVLVGQVLNQDTIAGTGFKVGGTDLFALYWTATMALLVPAVAVVASPRTFGVALLGGWLTTAIAEGVFYASPAHSVFALTLLVLLALTIALAATARRPLAPVATDPTSRLA
jgi:Caspase domain